MRAIRRAVATNVVVALVLILAACGPTPTPAVARDRAAAWLVNQFGADGVIAASFDPDLDDLGGTASAVASLAGARTGAATARRAAEALAERVDEYVVDGSGDDRPGSLARLVLAAEATGLDPRSFGGGGENLVARLQATMRRSGPDRGLFGVQSPTYDGAFRQGLALAALSLVRPRPALLRPGQGRAVGVGTREEHRVESAGGGEVAAVGGPAAVVALLRPEPGDGGNVVDRAALAGTEQRRPGTHQ